MNHGVMHRASYRQARTVSRPLSLRHLRALSVSSLGKTPTLHRDMRWDLHFLYTLMCHLFPGLLVISFVSTLLILAIPVLALGTLVLGLKRGCYYLTRVSRLKLVSRVVMLALDGRS